eukprot:UN1505
MQDEGQGCLCRNEVGYGVAVERASRFISIKAIDGGRIDTDANGGVELLRRWPTVCRGDGPRSVALASLFDHIPRTVRPIVWAPLIQGFEVCGIARAALRCRDWWCALLWLACWPSHLCDGLGPDLLASL